MGNVIRSDDRRWPDGRVPYVIGDGVPEAEVQAAIAQWTNSGAPVSFVPYTGPRSPFAEPYILFVLGDSATACNTVTGRRRPGQRVYCQPGFTSSLVHELGHTLGLKHEQQRFDRNLSISVLTDNIQPSRLRNFTRLSVDEVISIGPYDFESRMHYGDTDFAVRFEINVDIPGISSRVAPAVAFLGQELHVVFTDSHRDLFHTWTTDLVHWENPDRIKDQSTKAPPALVEFRGDLFLTHIGGSSNDVWISRSRDGRTFEPNQRISSVSSRAAPAVAVHRSELHMLFVGDDDNQIRRSRSSTGDPGDWTAPEKINQTSKTGAAIATDGNMLHLTHIGNSSDDIWYSTSPDGVSWTPNRQIGQTSKATPGMAYFGRTMRLVHLGDSSNTIWYARGDTEGGVPTFGPNVETNQFSRQRPSLAVGELGGEAVMILSHLGDSSGRVYVSRYNPNLHTMVRAPGVPPIPFGGDQLTAGDVEAVRFMYG
jgi:hypothetical protein